MCTGVRFSDEEGNMYFGRNLDWCESYGEGVVITPRGASIPTQFLGSLSPEHACVGMGIVVGYAPLGDDLDALRGRVKAAAAEIKVLEP